MDLSGLELRLACDLSRDGYAACHVVELCRDAGLMNWLLGLASMFEAGPKVAKVREDVSRGLLRPTYKPFVVKYQEHQQFTTDHPLYRFGMLPALSGIVNEAVGQPMRLHSADLWYVLPNASDADRNYGSSWHRDPEDVNTVKVYLFLKDVDEAGGAIEYVAGSHRADSKHAGIGLPQRYADQSKVEAISSADKRQFCYPAGTLLFFHAGGLHRGGYTRGKSRLNTVWTFIPEASPIPNAFTVKDHADHPGSLVAV